jgi:hypothetical protein
LIAVDLAPEVTASLRAMKDRGTPPPRCQTSYRYQWSDGGRSILTEEIKNEIYDGATPYSTYVRGVIVDGDRGMLLTGRDVGALIIEG